MSAITIRNIPDDVHDALRKLAKARGESVESFARNALAEAAGKRSGGIDFEEVRRVREAHGVFEDGPPWTDDLDDPALSRRLLGLEE
jgi:CubicO group peptidase (beta-lactamase class C family)